MTSSALSLVFARLPNAVLITRLWTRSPVLVVQLVDFIGLGYELLLQLVG